MEELLKSYVDSGGEAEIDIDLLRTHLKSKSDNQTYEILSNIRNGEGHSVMACAALQGNVKLLECLIGSLTLKRNRDSLLLSLSSSEENILHFAARSNQRNVLEFAFEFLNEENTMKLLKHLSMETLTPLAEAILHGSLGAVDVILNHISAAESSSIIMQPISDLQTVLHLAASRPGLLGVIQLLLNKVSSEDLFKCIGQQDKDGETPVMITAAQNNVDYARSFLNRLPAKEQKREVLKIKNLKMKTAEDIADEAGYQDMVRYLQGVVAEEPREPQEKFSEQKINLEACKIKLIIAKQKVQEKATKTEAQQTKLKKEYASNTAEINVVTKEFDDVKSKEVLLLNQEKEISDRLQLKIDCIQVLEDSQSASEDLNQVEGYNKLLNERHDLEVKLEAIKEELQDVTTKKETCEHKLFELRLQAANMPKELQKLEEKLKIYNDQLEALQAKLQETEERIETCDRKIREFIGAQDEEIPADQEGENYIEVQENDLVQRSRCGEVIHVAARIWARIRDVTGDVFGSNQSVSTTGGESTEMEPIPRTPSCPPTPLVLQPEDDNDFSQFDAGVDRLINSVAQESSTEF